MRRRRWSRWGRELEHALESVQPLAGEAVVADRLHRARAAGFVSRAAHAGGVDVEAARLRVLEEGGSDAGRKRSAVCTMLLVLSTTSTWKMPPKNCHAASQAAIAVRVVSSKQTCT